jgi:Uma2 family endonuclease
MADIVQQQIGTQDAPLQVTEKMSFEEFLKRYEGVHAELVRGEVRVYSVGNNAQHQDIIFFLGELLNYFLRLHKLGRILLAGIVMRVGDEATGREPDLMVLLNDHAAQLKATYVQSPVDIAVEVVSPESTDRDRGAKFGEYEAAKVPEYWLIDPLRKEANIYALNEDGRYRRLELDERGHLISTILPKFSLDPNLLWQSPVPGGPDIAPLIEAMGK